MTGPTDADPLSAGLRRHLPERDLSILARSRVGIAGAGGLGSNTAMLLARTGVGGLVVVDGDVVDASNLNRQWYFPRDLGMPKVEALGRNLAALAPALEYRGEREWLTPALALERFAACEVVVEALDDAAQKTALCVALVEAGFFVVAASGIGGYGRAPLTLKTLGGRLVCVGDFSSGTEQGLPMLAPRVMQAAALQADAVITRLLHQGGPLRPGKGTDRL